MKKYYLVMQNRSMISEISARLLSSGVFQFIGLSHNGFELENKMGQISSSDIIIVEDCFSGDELHEIVRFINGKAASVLGARRIFKALIYAASGCSAFARISPTSSLIFSFR